MFCCQLKILQSKHKNTQTVRGKDRLNGQIKLPGPLLALVIPHICHGIVVISSHNVETFFIQSCIIFSPISYIDDVEESTCAVVNDLGIRREALKPQHILKELGQMTT